MLCLNSIALVCCFQDMRRSDCALAQILAAGQWKSKAFLKYLDEASRFLALC